VSTKRPGPPLADLFRTADRKPTVILLAVTVLGVVYRYFGSKAFFLSHLASGLPSGRDADLFGGLYTFGSSFVLFGLVPVLIVKTVFREPLSAYGVTLGDWSFGWKVVLFTLPLSLALSFGASRDPAFLVEYPLIRAATGSAVVFAGHAAAYLLFYVGWEVAFRGFVQFGLRGAMGDWNAILVQTLGTCLLHIGKPFAETMGAIVGGVVWGVIAFRSRSLLYPILTHWLLGISLDLFIALRGEEVR
jgi:membrane protease YdiL (CAAX protease family)